MPIDEIAAKPGGTHRADVIRAAAQTVAPAAAAKDIRVQLVLDPTTGPVSGDPNRLQQVFWNLMSNAIKFTPEGGRVQVLLERISSHLEISVIDSGEGIDPAFLPHVFLLEERGATVSTASSATETLTILQAERPDVLISDIGMPDEDGYTLIRRVRSLRPEDGGRTPAIALTACARAKDRVTALVAGFQHHLSKPIEPVELLVMVASLAGKS